MSGQASNVFSALPVGTYSATVTDNAGATITLNNIVVGSSYINMNPTTTATTEVCGGSNTGSIKLSLPAAQGTSPYTYQIVSGPTSQAPATGITALSYTFQNLAPGSYRVSVTDACGLVQARNVVLAAGPTHTDDIRVWAYSSADCSTTDYYVQPQIGTYYPHTYYAYPNGDLSQTPYTITFTGSQLIATPYNGQTAFKWTLPTPSPWLNGKYAFKYTDICNTDVNSASVHAATITLGDYTVTTSVGNCLVNLNAWVGNGYTFPVTVTVTPQGGTALQQQITDYNKRTASFTNVIVGKTYDIVITDACGRTITTQRTINAPDLAIVPYQECGGNLDGVKPVTFSFGGGWQRPVTASITSGPATYHSTLLNQDITASYPVNVTQDAGGYARFYNLAPGTYNFHFDDGCIQKDYPLTVSNTNLQSFNFPSLVTDGCVGAQTIKSTATVACGGMGADVRTAANGVVANGWGSTFTQTNVQPNSYNVYYYIPRTSGEVFVNPNTYPNNTNMVLINTMPITVPLLDSHPSASSSGFAQCSSGSLQVTLNKTGSSPNISTYSIEKTAGQGDYYSPQASNVFTIADYGVHAYKVTDVCGNAGTGFIDVEPPTFLTSAPATICSGTKFTATFTPAPANATISWSNSLGERGTGNIDEILTNASSAPITVTYTVLANSTTGCSSGSQLIIVTVNPIPAITSTADTQTICSGDKAVMNFTSSLPGTTFSWTADDGTSGTGNVSEIKTNTGTTPITITYTITGVTADGCSSLSKTGQVIVKPGVVKPTASVTTQPTCALATGTIAVTAPVGAGYTYSVDGTNYQSATTFSDLATGSYNVTVKNSDGCTSVSTLLTINSQPATPIVNINPVSSMCANSPSIQLVGTPGGGTFSGAGVSSGGVFSPNTAGVGSHTINYSYTNLAGCTAVATTNIDVLSAPTLAINPSSQTICAGSSASMAVVGDNGGTVTWSSNYLGLTGTGTSFDTGVLTNSGTAAYILNLTAAAIAGSCQDKVVATVTVLPEPRVIPVPESTTICSYEKLHVTLSSVIAGTSISWIIVDNSNSQTVASGSGIDNVLITNKLPSGSYSLKVTGTKDGCTSRVANVPVVVN